MHFLIPHNEPERLNALKLYALLDTPAEPTFDRITALAGRIFDMPVALVSLVDEERLWFKSKQGQSLCEIPRGRSFCAQTIMDDQPLVVPDATADPRFADTPLVTGEAHVRFYAGAPLKTPDGYHLGALCVLDGVPRTFTEAQTQTLADLASMVVEAFEARRANAVLAAEIRDRQQAETALRKAEALKAGILDAALDGIITINHRGTILELNPAAERMFGVTEQEAVGREMAEIIIPAKFRDAHRRGMAHLLATGEGPALNKRLELRAQRSDGTQFPVELVITRILSDGPPIFTGHIRDTTERRARENRLRMLESSVANANDAIIITEAEPVGEPGPRIIYANQAFSVTTGYSTEEIIGKTPRILQGPKTSPETRRQIRQALEAWQPVRTELINYRKDGTEFWVELNIVPVANEKGWYTHWVSVQRDITERKQIEHALQQACADAEQAAAKVKIVLESISDAFFSLDRDWCFTYVNAQAERLLRHNRDELLGRDAWTQFPEVVGGVFDTKHRASVAEGRTVSYETFYEPFGVWLGVSVYPSSEGISVYLKNITARKNAQKELENSNHLLRAVIDGTDNIIFIKDRESRYLMMNPAGAHLFGCTPEEVIGKDDTAFFAPESAREIHAFDQEIIRTDRPQTYETTNVIGGMERVFMSAKSPYRDAAGNLLGVIGIVREITAQRQAAEAERQARQEAEKANLAKSEFLSRMSHELRTPLNAILGFGQLLEVGDLSKRQTESLAHILKAGRHLLALIDDVLAISRIEAGNINLSLEPVLVSLMVRECLALVSLQGKEREVQCRAGTVPDATHGQRHILADRQRLRQVLLNFLSNAIKYNRPGGTVTLSCRELPADGSQAVARMRLEVADTGHGLKADEIARLFTPFERLQAGRSTIEGTGLGLAVSKSLVEAMRGHIGVESVPGQGSTFWVELPVADDPASALQRDVSGWQSGLPAGGHAATILYIEDNLSNLRLIQMLLEDSPETELLSAEQGQLGIEVARARQPDLILLDLHLPDLPGWEVLDRLQADERTRDIPTVIISADATPRQITRLLAAGAKEYLTKPINVPDLLRVIRENIEPCNQTVAG